MLARDYGDIFLRVLTLVRPNPDMSPLSNLVPVRFSFLLAGADQHSVAAGNLAEEVGTPTVE
ncbi:hypothetical protein ZHAS_00010887 [Anopheles sinensis]|uniref:Uncharacterized protein n=1 Tax=Anopheles sinensis TaxID=74873 RepID=A0A084VYS5_ANOSI|nr:hypothetical protein ZHAS_00010887 [Anopheles sinensis]